MGIEHLLDLARGLFSLLKEFAQGRREFGKDELGGSGAGDRDGLLAQGRGEGVDECLVGPRSAGLRRCEQLPTTSPSQALGATETPQQLQDCRVLNLGSQHPL